VVSSARRAGHFDEAKIDAIFAALNQSHLPGAAVGIAIGGRPVYRKGFGLANMELPVVLSPTIRMRIASATKHFACLAYMLLCEEGRAGLDDPIGKYLPELHPISHHVTFRQLMGNVSGLRDVFDISWSFCGTDRSVSSSELLSLYGAIDDVNAAPGNTWIYNNGGFLILSVAIERIAGKSLEEVLRERIFEPVGMYCTLLRRHETNFEPNSATHHIPASEGGYRKSNFYGTALAGEGGMVSTIDDMLRWLAHMDSPVVGSPTTWQILKTPQVVANGTSTGYGLGLFLGRYRGVETVYHPGGGIGGNAQMLAVPAARLHVVVLVNRGDVWASLLAERILDTCLPGLDTERPPSNRPFSSGTFRSRCTGRVIQLLAVDGQQIASINGTDVPVESGDDGALYPVGIHREDKQVLRLSGDPASPVSIRFCDLGNVDELPRRPPAKRPEVEAIAGRYCSDATHTEAVISEADDGPRLMTVGRFGSATYQLECLAEDIWRATSKRYKYFGGILSFESGNSGFRFSSHRTWALPFRRCT
jgi:CubicO group peptidase (beta-lactamase class C family)